MCILLKSKEKRKKKENRNKKKPTNIRQINEFNNKENCWNIQITLII